MITYTAPSTGFTYPLTVLFLVPVILCVVMALVMKFTMLGRGLYAIGGDANAARIAGFNVRRLQFFAYIFCGVVAGATAMIYTTLMHSSTTSALMGDEMIIIAACGAFNGFIIGYFGLPAMLVTLCGLQLYTGLAYGITGGPAINGMCDAFKNIANGTVAGIPYVLFIFIAVVAVVVFIMKCTVFGHEIYFLGSNAQAAMYSGINTLKVTIMTYMFSGILGGISGILITSHLNSAKSSNGSTYTLLSLLIVVLGGVHPDGGKGRVAGVVLAVLLLQMIANAFGLMHMSDNAKTFANGCLLIAALVLSVVLEKREAQKAAAAS